MFCSGGINVIAGSLTAGTFSADFQASSGAARSILRAGIQGITNGFTVSYDGTNMAYAFMGTGAVITIASTVASTSISTGAVVIAGGLSVGAAFYAGGNLVFSPGSTAPSLAANGQVTFELTSNTTLSFKARGSDGTTRTGTVTLS